MTGNAPAFTLQDSDGKEVSLPDQGLIVLYFYPKADTPGCTLEAQTFKQLHPRFVEAGAMIWGVSPDDVDAVRKFKEKYGFPFTLLADTDHRVAEEYDVWQKKRMAGNEYMGVVRTTFLIMDGEILGEWEHKPGKTEEEVLSAVQELTAET